MDQRQRGTEFASGAAQRAGPFQFAAELDRQALGSLWLAFIAEGIDQGRLVQVRRIARGKVSPAEIARLAEAGKVAKQIRDPHLAGVVDVVQTHKELVVASEYVDAEPVSVLLRLIGRERRPLPVDMALTFCVQLLQALCTARDQWTRAIDLRIPERAKLLSAVYGGLTPDNIMLGASGDVIVTDIGVSGVASGTKGIGSQPDVLAYRAPEQFVFNAPVDERADLFSVGVLLWELVSGRPLFRHQNSFERCVDDPSAAAQIAERIRKVELPGLDRGFAPIPQQLLNLLGRAVAREVSDRFQTLEAMLGALHVLDKKCFAANDELGRFVSGLAEEKVAARRAAVALVSGESDSQPPTSSRPTKRPQKPERIVTDIASQVPKLGFNAGSRPRGSFPEQEAPTVRRSAALKDDYLGSMLAVEEPTVRRPAQAAPAELRIPAPPRAPTLPKAEIPPPPAELLAAPATDATLPAEPDGPREASQSLSPAEGSVRRIEPRRNTLVIASAVAILLGAIGLSALLLRSDPEPERSSAAHGTKLEAAKVEEAQAKPEREEARGSDGKTRRAATEPASAESEPAADLPAPEAEAEAAESESQDAGPGELGEEGEPSSSPPANPPTRSAPRPKPAKTFRPSGI